MELEGGSGSWARLPSDLLDLVLKKLISDSDRIRFGAICKHWQSVAFDQKQQSCKSRGKQLPLLLLVNPERERDNTASLYSVTKGKTFSFRLQRLPYRGKWCCGSFPNGWLAFADKNMVITLFNPFTGRTIVLPPLTKLRESLVPLVTSDYYVNKVVLSADPSLLPNDYEAMVLCHYRGTRETKLAYFKSGDETWTHIDVATRYCDAIYHRGQFLAVTQNRQVVCINVTSSITTELQLSRVVLGTSETGPYGRQFLVESSKGDLLLVKMHASSHDFEVFKTSSCVFGDVMPLWVATESIGSDALFLGENVSLSVSALDFPECQWNCIYIVDHSKSVGVINLENRNTKRRYCSNRLEDMRPPIWILPSMV